MLTPADAAWTAGSLSGLFDEARRAAGVGGVRQHSFRERGGCGAEQGPPFFDATGRDDLRTNPKFATFAGRASNIDVVYAELARRLGVMPSNVTHTTKPTLIN